MVVVPGAGDGDSDCGGSGGDGDSDCGGGEGV